MAESNVSYHKMNRDFYRRIAEFAEGDEKKAAAENTLVAYDDAMTGATQESAVTCPICLGLALHFSIAHYGVPGNPGG